MSGVSTGDVRVRSVTVDSYARMVGSKQLRFRDDDIKVYSDADGSLTVEADTAVKIVNPENQADGTLSGTPLLMKVTVGGVPYYFKIYPTVV